MALLLMVADLSECRCSQLQATRSHRSIFDSDESCGIDCCASLSHPLVVAFGRAVVCAVHLNVLAALGIAHLSHRGEESRTSHKQTLMFLITSTQEAHILTRDK